MKRRAFLKSSGALVVSFSMARVVDEFGMPSASAAQLPPGFNGTGSNQLDAWLAIGADGGVTAFTGKCELGHGLYTVADAAHRRRAVRAVQSRQARSMRHGRDARSGHDVRRAVASDEFQSRQPRAGRRDGARGTAAAGGAHGLARLSINWLRRTASSA